MGLFTWFLVVGYPREIRAGKDGSHCLLPHRQVYGLHTGTTYAHRTLLTLGCIHSKDTLQSHTNKAHLGWCGRERDKRREGSVSTEGPSLWSTCCTSEVALSTHRHWVSEVKRSSGFTLNFSGLLQGLSPFLLAELPASSSKVLGLNGTWQMRWGMAYMLCKPSLMFCPDPFLTDQEDADTPKGCNFGGAAPTLGSMQATTGRWSHCQSMGRAASWWR